MSSRLRQDWEHGWASVGTNDGCRPGRALPSGRQQGADRRQPLQGDPSLLRERHRPTLLLSSPEVIAQLVVGGAEAGRAVETAEAPHRGVALLVTKALAADGVVTPHLPLASPASPLAITVETERARPTARGGWMPRERLRAGTTPLQLSTSPGEHRRSWPHSRWASQAPSTGCKALLHARLEHHPESTDPRYRILPGPLSRGRLAERHAQSGSDRRTHGTEEQVHDRL